MATGDTNVGSTPTTNASDPHGPAIRLLARVLRGDRGAEVGAASGRSTDAGRAFVTREVGIGVQMHACDRQMIALLVSPYYTRCLDNPGFFPT